MKIQGNNSPERKDIYDASARKTNKNKAAGEKGSTEKTASAGKQSGTSDSVNLSEQAKKISRLKARMEELPDVRAEEVKAIKEAIETNRYHLDSLKVAENILKEM